MINKDKAVLTDARIITIANEEFVDDYNSKDAIDFARAIEAAVLTSADNPSTAGAASALVTLKSFWTGEYWSGVSKSDCDEIDAAFATLAAPVAQSTAGADKIEEIRALLEEAHGFAAVSPRGKENINAALGLLDDLAAPAAQATMPTAAEVRDQALEEAEAICQRSDINYAGQAAAEIRALRTASKGQQSTAGAAKAIEGLETYMPRREGGAMQLAKRGNWIRRVDVERLLAAPAAQAPAGLDLAKLRALVDAARVCTSVTSMREIVECIGALGEKGGDDADLRAAAVKAPLFDKDPTNVQF